MPIYILASDTLKQHLNEGTPEGSRTVCSKLIDFIIVKNLDVLIVEETKKALKSSGILSDDDSRNYFNDLKKLGINTYPSPLYGKKTIDKIQARYEERYGSGMLENETICIILCSIMQNNDVFIITKERFDDYNKLFDFCQENQLPRKLEISSTITIITPEKLVQRIKEEPFPPGIKPEGNNSIETGKKTNNPKNTRRNFLNYFSLGLVGGLASALVPTKLQSPENLKIGWKIYWVMPSFLNKSNDDLENTILWSAPDRISEKILNFTDNNFYIEVDRDSSIKTNNILRGIEEGHYKCGYSGAYYGEKNRILYFSCAIPFGLNPQEQNAWLYHKKEKNKTISQWIYEQSDYNNIVVFPAGATGAQMGGWFKNKIKSLADLKNVTMRIPGLGEEVFRELDAETQESLTVSNRQYTIKEAIQQFKEPKGIFNAFEWIGPHDDLKLGLDKVANYYYYPGWWEPGTTFHMQINKEAWNSLPLLYQQAIKQACFETHMEMLSEYNQKNIIALKEISKDVEIIPFGDEIVIAAREETEKLLIKYTNAPKFKEVYDEWKDFQDTIKWIDDPENFRNQ